MSIIQTIKRKFGLVSNTDFEQVKAELDGMKKKSSSWERMFGIGTEWKIFGDAVNKPYEQISSVYKAIKAIADNVPQADLKFRNRKTGEEIKSDPIIDLFNSPNPYMSESDLIQAWVGFACLYGEAFIVKQMETVGQSTGKKLPSELWAFNPKDFQEIAQGRMITGWRYSKEQIIFQPNEVIFVKDFNPYNMFRGIPPTKAIEKIIDIDWQSLIYNKSFFDNNAMPDLALVSEEDLDEDIAKRYEKVWEKKYSGASKGHKVAIIGSGLKPTPLGSLTHRDMEFLEQKKFAREEILGIWRAPKALFNITDDLNYATFIGQMKIFWSYGIMPIMRKIEGAINRQLVWPYNPNIEAYFDYSNVVAYQEDFKEKVTTGEALSRMGVPLNAINERLQLGFDKFPWGDVWWASFGLYPVSSAEAPALSSPGYEDPKEDEDKKDIALKTAKDERRDAAWKAFIAKQGNVERGFSGAISKYFFEQRKTSLSALNDLGPDAFKINWDEQNEKLKDKATKWIGLSVRQGIDFGRTILGKKSLTDDQLNSSVSAYLSIRTDKITQINETIRKQIFNAIKEGTANGETVNQIADRVREIYNMASSRSLMIARTETVGAVNGGSQIYYESEGVQKKEWLTARDEHVRDAHRVLEGQVVAIKSSFSNGLDYPGDQKGDAGESINCRCTLLPIIE